MRFDVVRDYRKVIDPIALKNLLWPQVQFYRQQREIIYSVRDDDETVVVAGNMLGKDFVAGFICLWFFLTRHPCRIVTTSAKDQHLSVLWGEIGQFVHTSRHPLVYPDGPLVVNHQDIRKVVDGDRCPKSYLRGMVASSDSIAAMQGHHIANVGDGIPRTLFVADECSSVPDEYYTMASTWMNRALLFGNPWPCTNFFYRSVKGNPATNDPGGDILREGKPGYLRRVLKICAEDSPNVRLGIIQESRGEEPTDEVLIPGVKGYAEYKKNLRMWDPIQQCVSLKAEFYEGDEVKLFPQEHLELAFERADELERLYGLDRRGKNLGVDTAEGGDSTVITVGDSLGFIRSFSRKTDDTSVIEDDVIRVMREYGISAERVLFDRGGGGKQIADRMRRNGYNVRTVGFGESAIPEKRRGVVQLDQRKLEQEVRYAYINRRAEMYSLLSDAINPVNGTVYGIPRRMIDLANQLRPIPRLYDKEGRLWLPPKNKPPGSDRSTVKTMQEMIGRSPDDADSAVLCYFGQVRSIHRPKAGAVL